MNLRLPENYNSSLRNCKFTFMHRKLRTFSDIIYKIRIQKEILRYRM